MTLRLNGSTSGYVEIDAPATAGSNTLVLPTGNGTNGQVLSTNGSGALSWAQGGRILQVVQSEKTDTTSFSGSSGTFNTFLSASIAPSSATNKILIMWSSNGSTSTTSQRFGFRLLRDSTATVGVGDAGGSRIRAGQGGIIITANGSEQTSASQIVLDSPSTVSSVTYALQVCAETGSGTVFINRSATDNDNNTHFRTASHLILLEVAA